MPLSSDPLPPSFGRYQLLSKVASGGMAEIWLARSAGVYGFEKRIVIKRILPELRDKPRYRDLFIQEARLCAGMSHPNIVSVFDLGQVQDEPYMAMEHIHGRDLLKVLRLLRAQEQRLPLALAVTIAAYVARALAYAHSRVGPDGRLLPILHRDVSPHNILITFEGEVKLVDFGIAQAGEAAGPGGGKQGYMSPEQLAGAGDAGGAGTGGAGTGSDVYALGVVLYEMISGKRLFPDREESGPAARLRPLALDMLLPDCPAPLRTLLSQALQPDPAARIDAAQFETQLRRFLFEAGHHSNSMALAALMQGLFAQELAREPGRAELQRLAQDLDDLHTGLNTGLEPSPPISERSPRPARGLAGRGERRPVALVAAELSGATELSLRLDAEELAKRNFRLLRAIRRSVGEMGGVIIRYEDGSLLAGFGLERAHADDAERALCWAQALLRLIGRLRKQRRQESGALELSIGVHVGEVMIGPRRGWRWRILPSGDTQRLCLLLAGAADPGSVLASDRVVALVGDRFPFDRGPELRRKGGGAGARRSPTFRLLGGRRSGGGWGGGRWHRRGEELEVLRDSIAALGQPEPIPGAGQPGGRGARILVRGEAGSGKSRLFREIRELALRRNIPVFLGRAIPFGGDRPFAMFRDLISDVLGIRGEMDGPAILERLGRLAEFGLGPAEIGMIRSLYGLRLPRSGQEAGARAGADRAGAERAAPSRDTIFAAAALLIRGISADGPVIVLLEDVHCLQGMERALFMQMLQAAESEPLLVLMSSREPMSPGAGRTRELRLPALPPEQVLALAAEILGAERTGPDLSRLLQRTAEGNPLYVAEILKALHRQGRIWFEGRTARLKDPQIDPGLPDSLNGLIAERVDALDRDDRLILQIAAVIGSRFSSGLLLAALKQAGLLSAGPDPAEPDPAEPDPAEPQLDRLLKAGLLQRDPEDDRRCGFASVLIWECVNHGIPSGLRRELHGFVARGLEQLHPDGLSAVIESWATHCHAAGRVRDAAAGLCEAADQLRDGQLLDRALERYQRALAWVSGLDRRERDLRLEARISLGAGEIAHLLGHPGAERFLQVALDITAEEGPEELEGRIMAAIGKIYLSRSQTKLARGYLESALSISRHCRDTRTQVAVLWELGSADLMEGHTARARATYERGLEVAAAEPRLLAWMLAGMAAEALQRDDSGAAWDLLQQVLQRDDSAITGDRLLLGRLYNILGLVLFQQQRYSEALAEFRRSLELRRGMGFRWGEVINLHNIGDTLLSMQDIPGAYAAFEQSLEVARACSWERGIVMNALYLAYLRAHRGEPAMPDLERQIALARRLGDPETAITGQWLAAKLKGSAELQRQAYEEAKQAGFVSLAAQIGRG